nr:MAG TPA: hypothetical protein [Caudoviricetes sp.]
MLTSNKKENISRLALRIFHMIQIYQIHFVNSISFFDKIYF